MTDEYICKQDVVDKINANADDLEQNGCIPYAQGARAMAIVVEQIPPADIVLVVHGRWINEYWHGEAVRKCSVCKITQTVTVYEGKVEFNYCPYCGVKMRGEQE